MIKRLINKILYINFIILVFACINLNNFSYAEETAKTKIEVLDDGLYIDNISTAELESLFSVLEYNRYIYMPGWKYPPIFLQHIPYDFQKVEDNNKRINLFIKIMIPLTLKVNEQIKLERLDFLELRIAFKDNLELTENEIEKLETLAEKYDVFTRLKGLRRYNYLIEQLDQKINIIPPSILIANAAIETNWGASDALMKANSLYKELVWYTDEGLEVDDSEDDSYRIKIFPTLYDSINSYALKINSNINYEIFRHARANVLSGTKPLLGRNLVHNFYYSSNLENFLGLLDYTITFYELSNIDSAKLGFPDDKDFKLPN